MGLHQLHNKANRCRLMKRHHNAMHNHQTRQGWNGCRSRDKQPGHRELREHRDKFCDVDHSLPRGAVCNDTANKENRNGGKGRCRNNNGRIFCRPR